MNSTSEVNVAPAPMAPQEEQSFALVLVCGLATTALALFGVYLLDVKAEDFHIMGWYADYVLPVGALIVGVVAASGYGIASWLSGIKITRGLLWAVVVLQLAAYFAAQYIEFKNRHLIYRGTGKPVGFIEYFDATARSMYWKQDDGKRGEPLGNWGYAVRALEILGFVGGGLLVPVLLRKAPYCQSCRRYMRTRQIALVAASVPLKKVKKSDMAAQAAYKTEQEEAFAKGKGIWETMRQLAEGGKATEFGNKLAELQAGKKGAAKLPQRLSIKLVSCARCQSGWLHVHLVVGQGREIKQIEFARCDVSSEFVRALQPSPMHPAMVAKS